MLCLSRKVDYALIALGFMAERPGTVVAAREIATVYDLPLALLMNIMKSLQKTKILTSTRGTHGGYKISADLAAISLFDLIRTLEGKVEPGCDHDHEPGGPRGKQRGSVQAPIQALHYKLMQFLHDVTLADLVQPGRRIDVPVEALKGSRIVNKATMPAASSWRDVARELVQV